MKTSIRMVAVLLTVVFALTLFGCKAGVLQEEYDKVVSERDSYSEQVDDLQKQNTDLQTEYDALENEKETLEVTNAELQNTIDSAAVWFALSDEERADMLIVLQERVEAREAQAALEAQQGYETGITYEQLARTPDDYTGKKVRFTGITLQVIEGSGTTTLRIATRGRYNDVILVAYSSDITAVRVLEDDKITIFGVSQGLYTYESTGGGSITIPYIIVDQLVFGNAPLKGTTTTSAPTKSPTFTPAPEITPVPTLGDPVP